MDALLKSAVDELPSLTSSFETLHISAESAKKAVHSSAALISHSNLSSRRLTRAEHLFRHLRETLPTLSSQLSSLLLTVQSPPPPCTTTLALPSEWCRAKLDQIIPMVSNLQDRVAQLQALINAPSSSAFIETVVARANQACEIAARWKVILEAIQEWQPIVVAAAEGLGEERSHVPT
eukprot:GFKZ01012877.1.p1 GENE.GFKZ01012877.1~~GFKZ01012877.1.p1  ORF type:complete len:193 (+),score=27.69 GFKZ01012877.1:48-581(+)